MSIKTGINGQVRHAAGLLGIAAAACTYPNDHFGSAGGPATATTGATTESSAGETTSATVGTTTSAGTTAGSTSAGTATTSTTAPTTSTTGEPTTSDTSSGTTEPLPDDCWESLEWDVKEVPVAGFVAPGAFRVSADGFELVYTDHVGGKARPFHSARASLGEPFPPGMPFPEAWTLASSARQAVLAPAGEELIMASPLADPMDEDLIVSIFVQGVWSEPAPMPELGLGPGPVEQAPKLFDGGRQLYFFTARGPDAEEPLTGKSHRIYGAVRPDGDAGTPFGPATEVEIVGISDRLQPHFINFPTPSPDGLHMFFSTSYPGPIDDANFNGALDIYYVTRADVNAPWAGAVKIDALEARGVWNSPDSVTADGCQLFFHRWGPGQLDDPPPIFVGQRKPGN